MRKNKEKSTSNENVNNAKTNEVMEISETGYGLESVEKGTDFAEGDQNQPPTCGGL